MAYHTTPPSEKHSAGMPLEVSQPGPVDTHAGTDPQSNSINLTEKEDSEHTNSTDRLVKSPEEIRLVRKLDWRLMPILWFMYWFNYLDRNAITVARLDGLEKDLNLTATQYQTSVSILFVGYILGQIPSSECRCSVRADFQD